MNKIAVVFPGQGSQFIGMGKNLCQQFSTAKRVFEEAEEILGIPLRQFCFEGRVSELNKLTILFPAIITYGVASYKVFQEITGIKADYMAGHSLGEYAALVCSGTLNFADAIRLVEKRASLCQEHSLLEQGTMTVIEGVDADTINKYCQRLLQEGKNTYISCYNTEKQIVVSGQSQGVMELEDMVMKESAQVTPMIMMPPFHCPMLKPIMKEMEESLRLISFQKGNVIVIGNVSGMPYPTEREKIIRSLNDHLVKPVMWYQSMKYMQMRGVRTVVEMGARDYLSVMAKEIIPGCRTYAYGMKQDWELKKLISANHYRRLNLPGQYIKIVVGIKNYSKNTSGYDEKIMRAYKELEAISNDKNITGKSNVRAKKLLLEILDLKEVPEYIRRQYLEELEVPLEEMKRVDDHDR